MFKFLSRDTTLDVLAVNKSQPCYLNRQIIVLLSTLGVEDSAIEKKQNEVVGQWYTISTNPSKAQEASEVMSAGAITNIVEEMLLCGYMPKDEPFLSMMLQVFEASKMMELRARTRIYLPNGRSMMGCLDETKTLKYGGIFVLVLYLYLLMSPRRALELDHGVKIMQTPSGFQVVQSPEPEQERSKRHS